MYFSSAPGFAVNTFSTGNMGFVRTFGVVSTGHVFSTLTHSLQADDKIVAGWGGGHADGPDATLVITGGLSRVRRKKYTNQMYKYTPISPPTRQLQRGTLITLIIS